MAGCLQRCLPTCFTPCPVNASPAGSSLLWHGSSTDGRSRFGASSPARLARPRGRKVCGQAAQVSSTTQTAPGSSYFNPPSISGPARCSAPRTLCPRYLISGSPWDWQSRPNIKAVGEASGTGGESLRRLLPPLHTRCCLQGAGPGGRDCKAKGEAQQQPQNICPRKQGSSLAPRNHRGAHPSSSLATLRDRPVPQLAVRGVFPAAVRAPR